MASLVGETNLKFNYVFFFPMEPISTSSIASKSSSKKVNILLPATSCARPQIPQIALFSSTSFLWPWGVGVLPKPATTPQLRQQPNFYSEAVKESFKKEGIKEERIDKAVLE